jgi:hypothetical protein
MKLLFQAMLPNHKKAMPLPRFGGILRMVTSVAWLKNGRAWKNLLVLLPFEDALGPEKQ